MTSKTFDREFLTACGAPSAEIMVRAAELRPELYLEILNQGWLDDVMLRYYRRDFFDGLGRIADIETASRSLDLALRKLPIEGRTKALLGKMNNDQPVIRSWLLPSALREEQGRRTKALVRIAVQNQIDFAAEFPLSIGMIGSAKHSLMSSLIAEASLHKHAVSVPELTADQLLGIKILIDEGVKVDRTTMRVLAKEIHGIQAVGLLRWLEAQGALEIKDVISEVSRLKVTPHVAAFLQSRAAKDAMASAVNKTRRSVRPI